MKIWVFVALVLGVLSLGIWYDVSVWNECRASGHSWFYCVRLLGH